MVRLQPYYRELLQVFVLDDITAWKPLIAELVESLTSADVTASQAIKLHFHATQELVDGRGGQSAKHLLNRANLLAVELVSRLSDAYQVRSRYIMRAAA